MEHALRELEKMNAGAGKKNSRVSTTDPMPAL
jgi:hypothetical protein